MKKKQLIFILFFLTCFFTTAVFAAFEVQVSQRTIPEGESFQLYLRQDGGADQPDISPLNEDFIIVGQRKSYKSTYVNGKSEKFNENVLTLIPKKTGKVMLPPIRAGKQQSQAIELTVVPGGSPIPAGTGQGSAATDADVQARVFIRSEAAQKKPFIAEQVLYTVKLYSSPESPILDGTIIPPQAAGITVEQWGDVTRSRTELEGKLYDVIEYRFLLFPQQSGKITIAPVRFQGAVNDPNARNEDMMGFFGFSGGGAFTGFFGQKTIAVQSTEIILDVQPVPSGVEGNVWLPAKSVAVSEDLTPPKAEVNLGEALTRTITVMVNGVRDSQIPDLTFPDGAGYRQYPGKTDSKNLFDKNGIVGVKTRQIVFMPTKAGELVLPKLEIPWFDIATKQIKTAVLPERKIKVLASEGTSVPEFTPPVSSAASTSASAVPALVVQPVETNSSEVLPLGQGIEPEALLQTPVLWGRHLNTSPTMLFAAGILFGVVVMMFIWFVFHRFIVSKAKKNGTGKQRDISRQQAENQLKEACRKNDAAAAKEALIKIGAVFWPHHPPLTLTDMANRFDGGEILVQIELLNQIIYGNKDMEWDGQDLWNAFQSVRQAFRKSCQTDDTPVPPLYPH